METILIHGKQFRPFISAQAIRQAVLRLAGTMNKELEGKKPLFIAVLNGSFIFAADLLREMHMDCELSFVKMASYQGVSSMGQVKELIGMDKDIRGRTVVIIEDIVDTGLTLEALHTQLSRLGPAEIRTATLLFKPEAYKKKIKVDYPALEVPNDFLVGYGLDYDGLGRNLGDIYQAVD
ncbi:MAG TPA: hypoxanthine phosphoribosyltransferase [Bacteroidia bacterium]|jgi:hypoxanthine phosphoribosyltransferase|nr:hypoxanthine phosphoribosyltransferase [Bacteroidia bacterium]